MCAILSQCLAILTNSREFLNKLSTAACQSRDKFERGFGLRNKKCIFKVFCTHFVFLPSDLYAQSIVKFLIVTVTNEHHQAPSHEYCPRLLALELMAFMPISQRKTRVIVEYSDVAVFHFLRPKTGASYKIA